MNAKAKRCLAMGMSEEFRPRLSWAEASALTGGPAAPLSARVALGAGGSTDKALNPAAAQGAPLRTYLRGVGRPDPSPR